MKDIEKKLDILRSKKIKETWYCAYCWTSIKKLESHHIFTRKNKSTRRDLANWVCLCRYHHMFSNNFSAHLTKWKFKERLKEIKWEERYNRLKLKSYTIKNYKERELEEMYDKYNKKVLKFNN
jgi:hypothetical protein